MRYRVAVTLLMSILLVGGCAGAPGPSSVPAVKAPDPVPPAASNENPTGSFKTCAETVLPNGCVRWGFKADSVKAVSVMAEPAVPVKVLVGDTSAYVVPDGLWPIGKVTLRAKAQLVSGQSEPLPDGIFNVEGAGDGRSMLAEGLRKVASTPQLQIRSQSGISRTAQIAWIESTWLNDQKGVLEDAEEIIMVRSVPRRLTTLSGRRKGDPWAYTVVLGDKAWQRLPGDPAFKPADANHLGDIITWEPIRRMKDASTAALVGSDHVDGKAAWLMAVYTKTLLSEQNRGVATLVWLDKESLLPLRLWTVESNWVDLKYAPGEFANWGYLDEFSYNPEPRLPVPVQQFLDQVSTTANGTTRAFTDIVVEGILAAVGSPMVIMKGDEELRYPLAKEAQLLHDGKSLSFADLHANVKVRATVREGHIVRMEILSGW